MREMLAKHTGVFKLSIFVTLATLNIVDTFLKKFILKGYLFKFSF
jgi:hypothetical protein